MTPMFTDETKVMRHHRMEITKDSTEDDVEAFIDFVDSLLNAIRDDPRVGDGCRARLEIDQPLPHLDNVR